MNAKKIDYNKLSLPNAKQARKRLNKSKILRDEYSLDENIVNIGKNKTFHTRTYGCQSNVRDSETINGILKELGYT